MPASRPEPTTLLGRFVRLEPLEPSTAILTELHAAVGRPEVFAGGYGGGSGAVPLAPDGLELDRDAYVEWAAGHFRWDDGIVFGVRLVGGPDDGALVGSSTLADFDEARESTHIGWTSFAPAVWGTAVNPEVKLLMLGLAFDHGYGRVKLQADARNARSRAAILKLGAQFEGVLRRDQRRADGSWRDTAVYSVLADEWPTVRAGLEARLAAFGSSPVTLGRGTL